MTPPSNRVSLDEPGANMYGCQPCPKCGSEFRVPYRRGDDRIDIGCDCGFLEAGEEVTL